jgi:hypothetical protein
VTIAVVMCRQCGVAMMVKDAISGRVCSHAACPYVMPAWNHAHAICVPRPTLQRHAILCWRVRPVRATGWH